MTDLRSHDWIRHHACRRPSKIAISDYETGEDLSYKMMDQQVDSCAFLLASKYGVSAGDRVALLAQNCPEVFVIQAACARLRAILLPLNWRLAIPELDYMMDDATPKVIFADKKFFDISASISGKQTDCKSIAIGEDTEFNEILKKIQFVDQNGHLSIQSTY